MNRIIKNMENKYLDTSAQFVEDVFTDSEGKEPAGIVKQLVLEIRILFSPGCVSLFIAKIMSKYDSRKAAVLWFTLTMSLRAKAFLMYAERWDRH